MKYKMTGDWRCALEVGMPLRQGYALRPVETAMPEVEEDQEGPCEAQPWTTHSSQNESDSDTDGHDIHEDEEEAVTGL